MRGVPASKAGYHLRVGVLPLTQKRCLTQSGIPNCRSAEHASLKETYTVSAVLAKVKNRGAGNLPKGTSG